MYKGNTISSKFHSGNGNKSMGMVLIYLQKTRNMSSTMATKGKLSLNTRFNNEDNLNIERLQPFGRIGFVTI